MTIYLFIGGPAHGTYKSAEFTSKLFPEIHVPAMKKIKWAVDENPVMPEIHAVTYKKRTLFLATGERTDIMVESNLTDEQAWVKLGDFLAQNWIKEQHKISVLKGWSKKDTFQITQKEMEGSVTGNLYHHNLPTKTPAEADTNKAIAKLKKFIPDIDKRISAFPCPIDQCPAYEVTISAMIVHLNDVHILSFEKIADYVDSLPHDLSIKEKK